MSTKLFQTERSGFFCLFVLLLHIRKCCFYSVCMKRSHDSLSVNLLIFQQHTLLLDKADKDQWDLNCWLRKRHLLSPNYCQTIYSVFSFIEYSESLWGKNKFLDLRSVLLNTCPKLLSKPLHLRLPFILLISPHCQPQSSINSLLPRLTESASSRHLLSPPLSYHLLATSLHKWVTDYSCAKSRVWEEELL